MVCLVNYMLEVKISITHLSCREAEEQMVIKALMDPEDPRWDQFSFGWFSVLFFGLYPDHVLFTMWDKGGILCPV